jgi:hypothetical protein
MMPDDQRLAPSSRSSEHVQQRLIGKDEYRKGMVHASVPLQNADADKFMRSAALGRLRSDARGLRVLAFGTSGRVRPMTEI